jgi:hypothetical protein
MLSRNYVLDMKQDTGIFHTVTCLSDTFLAGLNCSPESRKSET